MVLDKYGILVKNKTISGGREWFADAWSNGTSRDLGDGATDPFDPKFKYTNGSPDFPLTLDGQGTAKLRATSPITSVRLWVAGPWTNTEMTCYIKRVGICDNFQLRSRSKHTQTGSPNCLWGNYEIAWNIFENKVAAEVEVTHPVYDRNLPGQPFSKTIPTDRYVGFKQVTRTVGGNKVLVKGYSNYTSTQNLSPGNQSQNDWHKDTEYLFDGTNATAVSDPITPDIFTTCGTSGDNLLGNLTANTLWLNPGDTCWIRINNVTGFNLRWFSVREINPIT